MTQIKFCGITNPEDAMLAAGLGVNMLGFLLSKGRSRSITKEKAADIIAQLPPFVKKVGLFVDEPETQVLKTADFLKLDLLQVHGSETPDYCRRLRQNYKVIKAVRIRDKESLAQIPAYEVDYILLDTFIEGVEGGTGQQFNWDLAVKAKDFGKPIFLAGGLTPENVREAVKKVQPYAVDVSSGIELSPRKKDYKKMKEFVENVKKASG